MRGARVNKKSSRRFADEPGYARDARRSPRLSGVGGVERSRPGHRRADFARGWSRGPAARNCAGGGTAPAARGGTLAVGGGRCNSGRLQGNTRAIREGDVFAGYTTRRANMDGRGLATRPGQRTGRRGHSVHARGGRIRGRRFAPPEARERVGPAECRRVPIWRCCPRRLGCAGTSIAPAQRRSILSWSPCASRGTLRCLRPA